MAVFAHGSGITDSIEPLEVILLSPLNLRPPPVTALGPVFVELALADAQDSMRVERLHVFGVTGVQGPLAGLLATGLSDADDTTTEVLGSRSPFNLAWVGNDAQPRRRLPPNCQDSRSTVPRGSTTASMELA